MPALQRVSGKKEMKEQEKAVLNAIQKALAEDQMGFFVQSFCQALYPSTVQFT